MDVNETLKDAGSEPDTIRKSKRKPVKKDFEDFEVELSKKSRLVNEVNENCESELDSKENVSVKIGNAFSLDSTQNENLVFSIEERIVDLDKLKSMESSEMVNNNRIGEQRRLSVKELLEIVEPKMSMNELQDMVGAKSFSTSPLKKTPNTKRFRNEWLKMSEFKDWLQPHSLPDKAVCTVCNKVLNAGKSELEKHGATRKHYNQLEQIRGIPIGILENSRVSSSNNLVQSSNISAVTRKMIGEKSDDCEHPLQLATSETQQPVEIVLASESPDQVMEPSKKGFGRRSAPASTIDLRDINTAQTQNQGIRMSGKRRSQKYRKAWESLPECQGWLEGIEGNVYKAKCTSCDKEMMADITVIRNHAQAKKHQKSCEYVQDESLSAILRKSFETAQRNSDRKANMKASAWSTFEANIENDSDDIQIVDFDSLSIKGDEENEEYDYELEGSEGKHYSNHNFTLPTKEKEKETVSQSKAIVSKLAPFWKASAIVNGHVTELKLSDYKGRYVVLIFYPQDFSRVCQSELLSVSDRISEFRALNADVVACSVDSYLAHQVWCRTPRADGGLANPKIALISDPTHSISKDYGCFMTELGHTLRAYYIIDYRGIIRNITINDIAVGRGTDELLRLVEAFQQTDETEACCPADWRSGQPLFS